MNLHAAERCQVLGTSPERATEMIGGLQSETCGQGWRMPGLRGSKKIEGRYDHNFQRCKSAAGEERYNLSLGCTERTNGGQRWRDLGWVGGEALWRVERGRGRQTGKSGVFGKRQEKRAGVLSKAQPHHTHTRALSQPREGAASKSGAADGVVELAIPAAGLGGGRKNWGQPIFPYCQVSLKIRSLGGAAGRLPYVFGARWDISLSLSAVRHPPAAVLSVTSPNGARGSSAPPLPHSAPRPCHCREEPQRWRPRSLMLAKRLEDK